MKFYKLTSPHNQDEINEIIMSMSSAEVDYITSIYAIISMVEYTDENGNECMFAILDDFLISKISSVYNKYSLKFKIYDLTKEIIFDNKIKINYKNQYNKSVKNRISDLINEFKMNWITKDDILDKILEKGITSLNDFDYKILKS
jgi:hypothetical protein